MWDVRRERKSLSAGLPHSHLRISWGALTKRDETSHGTILRDAIDPMVRGHFDWPSKSRITRNRAIYLEVKPTVIGSEEFVRPSTLTSRRRGPGVRGQSYVEFALIASALILLVLGGVQLAMILNAALAVSQYSYAGARYAAIHGTGQSASGYGATIKSSVAPPAYDLQHWILGLRGRIRSEHSDGHQFRCQR